MRSWPPTGSRSLPNETTTPLDALPGSSIAKAIASSCGSHPGNGRERAFDRTADPAADAFLQSELQLLLSAGSPRDEAHVASDARGGVAERVFQRHGRRRIDARVARRRTARHADR